MSSLMKLPNGRWRIQFKAPDGERRSIRPGKLNGKAAERLQSIVSALEAAAFRQEDVDIETHNALGKLPDKLYGKLADHGLVEPRGRTVPTLGAFVDQYIAGRTDVKEATRSAASFDALSLLNHFGRERRLRSITLADAQGYEIALKSQKLAKATVSRRLVRAKQFFRAAVNARLIAENPFREIKPASQANEQRKRFITRDKIELLMAACPNAEWRLVVALARFGGIRTPSETLELTWDDIDWEHGRITVRSPKTECHEGHESRVIPLFPELVQPLLDAQEAAPDRTVHVLQGFRGRSNLRTQMLRIIKKAGLEAWPKPFHNLRASRQSELAETHPWPTVCRWMGNSERVGDDHYYQVTEAQFEKASAGNVAHKLAQTALNKRQTAATVGNRDSQVSLDRCSELPTVADVAEKDSPRRTRTFNPAINSRMLYH